MNFRVNLEPCTCTTTKNASWRPLSVQCRNKKQITEWQVGAWFNCISAPDTQRTHITQSISWWNDFETVPSCNNVTGLAASSIHKTLVTMMLHVNIGIVSISLWERFNINTYTQFSLFLIWCQDKEETRKEQELSTKNHKYTNLRHFLEISFFVIGNMWGEAGQFSQIII